MKKNVFLRKNYEKVSDKKIKPRTFEKNIIFFYKKTNSNLLVVSSDKWGTTCIYLQREDFIRVVEHKII